MSKTLLVRIVVIEPITQVVSHEDVVIVKILATV